MVSYRAKYEDDLWNSSAVIEMFELGLSDHDL